MSDLHPVWCLLLRSCAGVTIGYVTLSIQLVSLATLVVSIEAYYFALCWGTVCEKVNLEPIPTPGSGGLFELQL